MAKKSKRARQKYPAINPEVNLKTRYEEIMDVASYFHTLPDDAKKFMHSFVEEYVNAKFDHPGKKIHKTKEQKRAIYNRNNARNRDILTRAKASGKCVELDAPKQKKITSGEYLEEALVAKIDYETQKKNKRSRSRKKTKKLNDSGEHSSSHSSKTNKS